MNNHLPELPIEKSFVLKGIFSPTNKDTLRSESTPFIGQVLLFEALWEIQEGVYKNQWAFRAINDDGSWIQIGWVPTEDINVIQENVIPFSSHCDLSTK